MSVVNFTLLENSPIIELSKQLHGRMAMLEGKAYLCRDILLEGYATSEQVDTIAKITGEKHAGEVYIKALLSLCSIEGKDWMTEALDEGRVLVRGVSPLKFETAWGWVARQHGLDVDIRVKHVPPTYQRPHADPATWFITAAHMEMASEILVNLQHMQDTPNPALKLASFSGAVDNFRRVHRNLPQERVLEIELALLITVFQGYCPKFPLARVYDALRYLFQTNDDGISEMLTEEDFKYAEAVVKGWLSPSELAELYAVTHRENISQRDASNYIEKMLQTHFEAQSDEWKFIYRAQLAQYAAEL